MTKTNLILAAALAVVLAACSKPDAEAPAAAVDAAPAAEATTDAAVEGAEVAAAEEVVDAGAEAAAASDMPQACSDYLARARACFEKAGNNAALASFQQGVDMAEAEWNKVADKTALASACTTANEHFGAAASALQCE